MNTKYKDHDLLEKDFKSYYGHRSQIIGKSNLFHIRPCCGQTKKIVKDPWIYSIVSPQ